MKFLSYDSPIMVFVRKLVDYMIVGILWTISCIPVFTYGAATTAALLTVETSIQKEEGQIWTNYWKWFRTEFKEATLLWLLWFPIQCLLVFNIWLVTESQTVYWAQVLICLAAGIVFCWTQIWFGYLSKFEDSIKTVLHNTFRMFFGDIGRTLLLVVILAVHIAAVILLFLLMPPFMLIVPGSYLLCYTSVLRKLFAKYLKTPENEAMQN